MNGKQSGGHHGDTCNDATMDNHERLVQERILHDRAHGCILRAAAATRGRDGLVDAHTACSIISSYAPPADDGKESLILDVVSAFDGAKFCQPWNSIVSLLQKPAQATTSLLCQKCVLRVSDETGIIGRPS